MVRALVVGIERYMSHAERQIDQIAVAMIKQAKECRPSMV